MPHAVEDRKLLEALFHDAVEAARPGRGLAAGLPAPPAGRTLVIGAGKASAHMASALEAEWPGPLSGLVVTSYGNAVPCRSIDVVEASHPVPDAAGAKAAEEMVRLVGKLGPDDLVIALISGGGSSLLPAPAPGLTLEDEQAINRALLSSGAPIGVMNVLRCQFSTIKAGRLALACLPAKVVSLVLSDVPGDDASLVSSGPTIPSHGTRQLARQYAELYRLNLPAAAQRLLASEENLVPSPQDARFHQNSVTVIASAALSLQAAAQGAEAHGLTAVILSDGIEGEARDIASMHAAVAREVARHDRPFTRPTVMLSGGETTVTVRGKGRGGRNGEFLLAFALAIEGMEGITALAADTDGIDGSEDNAGAFADGRSATRMRQMGIDPLAALSNNDAYSAFAAIGDLFVTGPTGTNVNDFRAIVVR